MSDALHVLSYLFFCVLRLEFKHLPVFPRSLTMKVLVFSTFLFLSATGSPLEGNKAAPVPVVLWHGMGDSAAGMTGIEVW